MSGDVNVLALTRESLKAKIKQEAQRLRLHIDGSARAINEIESLQSMLDGLEEIERRPQQQQQGLALPIGG